MTLLERYRDSMMKGFQEPERRGTTRGHEIGIFRSKYEAAVYSLFSYEQKEIAELIGKSFSFYRKLRTENNYKEFSKSVLDNYVNCYLFPYISDGIFYDNNFCTSFIVKFKNTGKGTLVKDDVGLVLADVNNYSQALKESVASYLIALFEESNLEKIILAEERIIYILTHWNEPEMTKSVFKVAIEACTKFIYSAMTKAETLEIDRNTVLSVSNIVLNLSKTI